MIEFYPQIKLVHVAAVLLSGGLFLLRGIAVVGGARWGMIAPVRFLSYGIDIVLLSAALMLLAILPSAMFANGWLWAKLAFLVAYVGLGSLALRRARSPRMRLACFIAALIAFIAMFTIARAHHPLGAVNSLLI
jgi:uncharacterized membrane protein SirB2